MSEEIKDVVEQVEEVAVKKRRKTNAKSEPIPKTTPEDIEAIKEKVENGTIEIATLGLGTITVLVDDVNIRIKPNNKSTVVKKAKKGNTFIAKSIINGLYEIGDNMFITSYEGHVKLNK